MGQTNPEVICLFLNDSSWFCLTRSKGLNILFFQMKNFIHFHSLVMGWCFYFLWVRILFPCEITEMLSTSQGHRLIMKRAFNLATQLLVGLMKIITSRGRCWVLPLTDYECLAFRNFPHSQIWFSSKVTYSPIGNEYLALFFYYTFLSQFILDWVIDVTAPLTAWNLNMRNSAFFL